MRQLVFKKLPRNAFSNWYALDLKQKLDAGESIEDVKMCLKLSVVKPLHAEWLKKTALSLEAKKKSFNKDSGLLEFLNVLKEIWLKLSLCTSWSLLKRWDMNQLSTIRRACGKFFVRR